MANRAKTNAKLESDIQIARDESNWKRVIDLAEQLRTRSPHLGLLLVDKIIFLTLSKNNIYFNLLQKFCLHS
jgi:hypothetical protein